MRRLRSLALLTFLLVGSQVRAGAVHSATAFQAEISTRSGSPKGIFLTINRIDVIALTDKEPNRKLAKQMLDSLNRQLREREKRKNIRVSEANGYITFTVSPQNSYRLPLSDLVIKLDETGKTGELIQARLNVAMGVTPLAIEPSEVVVPVGEPRHFRIISGFKPTDWRILNPFPEFVELKQMETGFSVFGNKEGEGYLTLVRGAVAKEIPFKVLYLSAYLPDTLVLEYTGALPDKSLIELLARSQVIANSAIARGTTMDVGVSQEEDVSIGQLSANVSASAEGRIKVNRKLPIELRSSTVALSSPNLILFSNRPEQVQYPGELYSSTVSSGEIAHLVYHHQNRSGVPLIFRVTIENLGGEVEKCLISGGFSSPMISTYDVGFRSAKDRLKRYLNRQAVVITLPAYGRTVLWEGRVENLYSVSGNVDISVGADGAIAVRVLAIDARQSQGVFTEFASDTRVQSFHTNERYYTPAVLKKDFTFHVDGHWLFIRLGKGEIAHPENGETLPGDYGVLYDVNVDVINDTPFFKRVDLSFDATAGPARGVFIVDGKLFETPLVTPGSPYRFHSLGLAPYERTNVNILTTTLNGSHYAASLIFSSD